MPLSQGSKVMFDLHGLSVKEVKKLLEEQFAKIEELNMNEFYLITGRGSHVNPNGSRGVLKKALPKLLKPYCQSIVQINQEAGAYKIIFKPKQELPKLKDVLFKLLVDEQEQIKFVELLKQKANENNVDALLALAAIHLEQAIKGFDNPNDGISLLLKAKQLDSLEAYVQLGILYLEGIVITQDHKKAFNYFKYGAEREHPVAQYYVAVCYLHGKGIKYNDKQAVKWMKKAADQNDADAQQCLSDFYLLGKITELNKDLGIHYKTKAAEQGLVEAQVDLARCYATGYGVKQNYPTAFKWYLSAAQSGHAYAVYQVGSYIINNRSGFPPDPVEAFSWFLKAAELGDADGQAQVAYQYLLGENGIEQDITKGLHWVLEAAKQENIHGYYVLALVYLKGLGVEQDGLVAYQFMNKAAEAGYSDAQYSLGILLFQGKDFFNKIPKNFDLGLKWLEKAMEQGHNGAAEIVQFLFKKHRDPNIFSAMLRDKMQVLLAIPRAAQIKPEPPITTSEHTVELSSPQENRYSMWYKGALAAGLTAAALGIGLNKKDEIIEGINTVCRIQ